MLAEPIFYLSGCLSLFYPSIPTSDKVFPEFIFIFKLWVYVHIPTHMHSYITILHVLTPGVIRWRNLLLQGHCGCSFSGVQRGNGDSLTNRNNQCLELTPEEEF